MSAPAADRGGEARPLGDILNGVRPKLRRTGQPVRRDSYHAGTRELRHWRPVNPREIGPRLAAAEFYDRRERQPGRRNGPLGHIGIEVLRELYRIVCYRSGRLEPSIDYLMGRIKRSRTAVVRALAALKRHGFLDWVRRTEPTKNEGRGPQIRQITNAYWFGLPKAALATLKRLVGKAPPPDDDAQRRKCAEDDMRHMLQSQPIAEQMAVTIDNPDLADSLTRLGEAVFGVNASSPNSQNPA